MQYDSIQLIATITSLHCIVLLQNFVLPGFNKLDRAWVAFRLQMAATTSSYLTGPCSSSPLLHSKPLLDTSSTTSPLPLLLIFHSDIQARAGGKAKLLTTAGWQQKKLGSIWPVREKFNKSNFFTRPTTYHHKTSVWLLLKISVINYPSINLYLAIKNLKKTKSKIVSVDGFKTFDGL